MNNLTTGKVVDGADTRDSVDANPAQEQPVGGPNHVEDSNNHRNHNNTDNSDAPTSESINPSRVSTVRQAAEFNIAPENSSQLPMASASFPVPTGPLLPTGMTWPQVLPVAGAQTNVASHPLGQQNRTTKNPMPISMLQSPSIGLLNFPQQYLGHLGQHIASEMAV